MRRCLHVLLALAATSVTVGLAAPGPAAAGGPVPVPPAARAPEAVPDQLLVGFARGATEADRQRARGRAAAVRQDDVVRAGADRSAVELVRLPQGASRDRAVRQLEADPAVLYAEPNWVYTHQATEVTDPLFTDGSLWGLQSATPTVGTGLDLANAFGTAAVETWKSSTGTAQVYVGVIDEGIQVGHPDLAGQVWTNPFDRADGVDNDGNGRTDDVNGWDFAGNDSTVYDGGTKGNADDHGTHVAGTLGARANGVGVVGMNHAVTLISAKFLGARGGTLDNAVRAVDYLTDLKTRHGLNIVATNNSWGGGGFSQALLDAIVRAARADILFVAAAGNDGTDNDRTASYPSGYDTTAAAGYDAVVAVAALDSGGGLASFSQYGRTTVDLGAPGAGIWSTTAPGTYEAYSGTSMATPHVTGAVALYEAARRTAADPGGPSAASVKDALLRYSVPTRSLDGKVATNGRLNVAHALSRTVSAPLEPLPAGAPTVTLTQRPVRGFVEVTVSWTGFVGGSVTVSGNGYAPKTTENDGTFVESWRGGGNVTYTVCETDGAPCVSSTIRI